MPVCQTMHQDNAALLVIYFCLNTALTLMNKLVAMESKHHVASLLGATHGAVTWLGCVLYERFKTNEDSAASNSPTLWDTRPALICTQNLKLFLFALLYTVNISLSNFSTGLASLSMWQSIRATGPLLTVLIVLLFDGPSTLPQHRATYISLLAIVSGVIISVHGERWDATVPKLAWTFTGALAAVVKSYIQHRLPKYGLHLPPNDLLLAILPYAIVQGLTAAYTTGEIAPMLNEPYSLSPRFMALFALSALVAFCLNVVSFRAFGRVAPTSMAVAANLKQVVILFLPFHQRPITSQVVVGTLVTVSGTIWYSAVQRRRKLGAAVLPVEVMSERVEARQAGLWQSTRNLFSI